jgi:hypothetical protein
VGGLGLGRTVTAGGLLFGWILLAVPASSSSGSDAQSLLAAQPPELVARLFDRKVVVMREASPHGSPRDAFFLAYVIFEVPPEDAYRLLAQTSRHIEFRPEVESIETVARTEEGPVDLHRLRLLFLNVRYLLRYHMDPAHNAMRWDLDPDYPNSLARAEGFWELYALAPGRTLGRFGAVVDVGPALPRRLQAWVTRKNLPRTIDRARRWVDSGGTYRP